MVEVLLDWVDDSTLDAFCSMLGSPEGTPDGEVLAYVAQVVPSLEISDVGKERQSIRCVGCDLLLQLEVSRGRFHALVPRGQRLYYDVLDSVTSASGAKVKSTDMETDICKVAVVENLSIFTLEAQVTPDGSFRGLCRGHCSLL